jgi:hypothetical protein
MGVSWGKLVYGFLWGSSLTLREYQCAVHAKAAKVHRKGPLDLNIKNNDNYYNYDDVEKRGSGGDS